MALTTAVRLLAETRPTISVKASSSDIPGSVSISSASALMRFYAGSVGTVGVAFPRDHQKGSLHVTPNYLAGVAVMHAPYYVLEFIHTGMVFEWAVSGNGGKYKIFADGREVSRLSATLASDGTERWIKVKFSSVKRRLISVHAHDAAWTANLRIQSGDGFELPTYALGRRMIVMGDSFTEGTGALSSLDAFARKLGDLLGLPDTWQSGCGGSGYLTAPGSGHVTFRSRIADITGNAPDIVLVAGGINDTSGYTAAAVETEAGLLFAAIKAALPSCKLVAVGPWWPSGSPTQIVVETRDAIRSALLANGGDLFIDNIGGPVPYSAGQHTNTGWITGTGKISAPTGSGNADLYTSSDGTHPSQAGHDYLALRLAAEMAPVVLA